MASINNAKVNVSFNGSNALRIGELNFHSMATVRETIARAQEALRALKDLDNGEGDPTISLLARIASNALATELGSIVDDRAHDVTSFERIDGKFVPRTDHIDFSDVPVLRMMDYFCMIENWTVENA